MKIRLNIPDALHAQLQRDAARRGCTISELVEAALLHYFDQQKRELPRLPKFRSELLVDIDNREALYEAMDGPELRKMYGTPDTK
jgi:hypothetical protein